MGNTLSIFFSETVQLIGTNLGHNSPLVDHTNQYIPTIMTMFGLNVLLTDRRTDDDDGRQVMAI
jgi:hypothetical protein